MTGDRTEGPDPVQAEALRIAAAGRRAGKGLREIAVDLYGAARADPERTADGWMRATVRRLLRRATDGTAPPGGPGPVCGHPAGGGCREPSP